MTKKIPADWMPPVTMTGIVWHWTAGNGFPSTDDLNAYHILIDETGGLHRGRASIALNSGKLRSGYAAHTKDGNTNRIGVSLCGMAGATEVPFNPGRSPITPAQIQSLVDVTRQLASFYGIPISRKTTLSHAEVEPTLGIKQRQKWDWSRLPDSVTKIRGAIPIGDWIRDQIIGKGTAPVLDEQPIPAGATGMVNTGGTSNLNTRNGPNGEVTGSIPPGVKVVVVKEDGDWLKVRTPAGFEVWVSRRFIEIVDGPPVLSPTVPDSRREMLDAFQALLDEYKAQL